MSVVLVKKSLKSTVSKCSSEVQEFCSISTKDEKEEYYKRCLLETVFSLDQRTECCYIFIDVCFHFLSSCHRSTVFPPFSRGSGIEDIWMCNYGLETSESAYKYQRHQNWRIRIRDFQISRIHIGCIWICKYISEKSESGSKYRRHLNLRMHIGKIGIGEQRYTSAPSSDARVSYKRLKLSEFLWQNVRVKWLVRKKQKICKYVKARISEGTL